MPENYTDLTIRWDGHPKYVSTKVIEDDLIEMIVQKLEMILFTNQNECFSDPEMGCNIDRYLWETKVPGTHIQNNIEAQITKYIPELDTIGYDLTLELYKGDERDEMYINFTIRGYNVAFIFE